MLAELGLQVGEGLLRIGELRRGRIVVGREQGDGSAVVAGSRGAAQLFDVAEEGGVRVRLDVAALAEAPDAPGDGPTLVAALFEPRFLQQ